MQCPECGSRNLHNDRAMVPIYECLDCGWVEPEEEDLEEFWQTDWDDDSWEDQSDFEENWRSLNTRPCSPALEISEPSESGNRDRDCPTFSALLLGPGPRDHL